MSLENELREALINAGYPKDITVVVEGVRVVSGYGVDTTMWLNIRVQGEKVAHKTTWGIMERGNLPQGEK